MPFKIIFYFHRGYSQWKEYAPYGEHIRSIIVVPFLLCGFLHTESYSTITKLAYRYKLCPFIAYFEFETAFRGFIFCYP